jgi:Rieske Fe-S protein
MSKEAQESSEDYLGVDQFIEQLRLQRSARPPANLAPQQTRIYGMAALFNTASSRVADPRPEFKMQLYQRLREQVRAEEQLPANRAGTIGNTIPVPMAPSQGQKQMRNIYKNNHTSQPAQVPPTYPESMDVKKGKARGVSRRTLFVGGTIAASVVASAGIGAGIGQALQSQPNLHPTLTETTPGTWRWLPITSVEHLGKDAIPFSTNAVSGYVMRQTENTSDQQIIAFSSACTHLGCPVQWQEEKRQFLCPCHTRVFDETGGPVEVPNGQPHETWLSRLDTKVENGNIYVKVPPSTSV